MAPVDAAGRSARGHSGRHTDSGRPPSGCGTHTPEPAGKIRLVQVSEWQRGAHPALCQESRALACRGCPYLEIGVAKASEVAEPQCLQMLVGAHHPVNQGGGSRSGHRKESAGASPRGQGPLVVSPQQHGLQVYVYIHVYIHIYI